MRGEVHGFGRYKRSKTSRTPRCMVIGSASKPCAIALRLPLPPVHRRPMRALDRPQDARIGSRPQRHRPRGRSDGRMPDYCARRIPHLKGLHRVLALRKQHVGLYDGLFVRDAGKFLSGYDMATSQKMAPHVELRIWSPGGSVAPWPLCCPLSRCGIYSGARQRYVRAGRRPCGAVRRGRSHAAGLNANGARTSFGHAAPGSRT